MFNVILFGTVDNYKFFKTKCNNLLKRKLKELGEENITLIYGGSDKNLDSFVEKYAKETNLKTTIVKANWEKYGKRAAWLRNKRMLELGNACIIFKTSNKEVFSESMEKSARKEKLLVRIVESEKPLNP